LSDGHANDLGDFVGVILEENLLELFIDRGFSLDEDENFSSDFFFTAPAIMGFKAGKDLNAGRELLRN